jgi:hypothetical protein
MIIAVIALVCGFFAGSIVTLLAIFILAICSGDPMNTSRTDKPWTP